MEIEKFPFDYQEAGPEETEELLNYHTRGLITKFIRLGAKGYFFHKEMDSAILELYNMEVRPSDTFVVTFPRSGTTWTQELVWLLQNDLDFEKAKAVPLNIRFPFVESAGFLKMNFLKFLEPSSSEQFYKEALNAAPENLKNAPSPRYIKSHMPLSLLPPSLLDTAKVVYVARNPRDVVVSLFYHQRFFQIYPKNIEFKQFWKLFLEGRVQWSPFFEHVKEAWNLRNHPNMIFIFYEDLLKNLEEVARRLAKFFGKEYSDEQFEALCNHLKFDNLKKNESVNAPMWNKTKTEKYGLIRKGKSGEWRDHFDEEMSEQMERWIADNLRDTDLQFPTSP